MKVIVQWEETWTRQAEFEIDEAEYRAWRAESRDNHPGEPEGYRLKEFIEAGRDVPEPTDLLGGTVYPGSAPGDVYDRYEITRVTS